MNRVEHIVVDIAMAGSDQNTAFDLKLIFLSFLFLLYIGCIALLLGTLVVVESIIHLFVALIILALRLLLNLDFILLLFFVWDVETFQHNSFELAVAVIHLRCSLLLHQRVCVVSLARSLFNVFILVSDNLNQLALFDDCHTLGLEPFLGLLFQIQVVESVLVNNRHIFCDLWVSLLIYVTLLPWNCQNDVLVLDASVN